MNKTTIYSIVLLIGLFVNSFGQSEIKKEKLSIPDGKVGLIGYGSLLSKKSMELTLGKEYKDSVRIVHLKGYERIWNHARPNGHRNVTSYFLVKSDTIVPTSIISLNIQPSENKAINSCLFIIDIADLAQFDQREYGYIRVNVKDRISEININSGDVYAYMALPDFTVKVEEDDNKNVITAGYVKIVEDAINKNGDTFVKEFYESTIPYSTKIVKTTGRKIKK